MATILKLVATGQLTKVDAQLGPTEQEWRILYIFPHIATWIDNTLPGLVTTCAVESTPLDQLDDLTWAFCIGEPLTYELQFKPLRHKTDGVWELKSPDLRLFGWFPKKDHFIIANADDAGHIKQHALYNGYCVDTIHRRNGLPLDDPKFIPGDDPHAVISDIQFR